MIKKPLKKKRKKLNKFYNFQINKAHCFPTKKK